MSQLIKVMLTDDHAVVRSGLCRLLEQNSDIKVIAEAESGEQAYQTYPENRPDVLVMDMSMPGMGGLEALRRILHRWPDARVIMFSMHENATYAIQSLTAGAMGYVAKSGNAEDLVKAVKEVASGKSFLSADMAQKVALQSLTGDDNPTQRLTSREFEVFRLLAEGKLVEEIAGRLNIGQKTVANYQTSLKQKLDIHSPVELVRLAMKYGVITEQ
ncbi:MAG: response regulator transcription factor [Pseudomonadota bacterium]|uniref:Response regulator containing a CheY-like receiver domain and an HTH DNA-binding domain containing protein n=1 Tax=Methylophaga aminisulfidivorans MP TaxID=1026882 RepID=F5T3B8_9GAMM|nr:MULTISPECIES: response regulator transcription factor [Methylophaga]EGL53610.1 response regulator containing a CheY-like receiver domain and an HTH DNA-binding domain containing protein [Methylophaga aminisulfidivorans MP]MEC9411368.1 response regulator transcription factor [Pseudomonadota bacterium]WVI84988.1 response regulator transcription factor [Methylophaga thalassica]